MKNKKNHESEEGITLTCHNKKCGYTWEYKGEHEYFATCPNCRNKVSLGKSRKEDGTEEETNIKRTRKRVEIRE